MKERKRIDLLLVERGLFESRQRAQSEIIAGNVLVEETAVIKPGFLIDINAPVRIKEKFPYVSRGALKLLHALDTFNVEIKDKTVIDIGSSTGGFTQVLLERGAALVYAVDVGTNQLDWKIRNESRVVVMEKTNARDIGKLSFTPPPEIAVADVSFISLTKILIPIIKILNDDYKIITLIKPQFELDSSKIGSRGLAKKEFRKEAVESVLNFARSVGLDSNGLVESPITGAKSGNIEYLAFFTKGHE